MARKHKHEEHANHEAWAIPYGDLVTLLLAFFVVMYAVSSVNEGKYRVLAEALSDSFGGTPKSMKPIQLGKTQQRGSLQEKNISPVNLGKDQPAVAGQLRDLQNPTVFSSPRHLLMAPQQNSTSGNTGYNAAQAALQEMGTQIQQAMGDLIERNMIRIRHTEYSLEIEMNTDILFGSGAARVAPASVDTLKTLADILKPFPNPLRIEGHTDNIPINTVAFPSNWELSAARAASVVHLFMQTGVTAPRMTVAGMGEFKPIADNTTADGRNKNRRVVIVVLADSANEIVTAVSHHDDPEIVETPAIEPIGPVVVPAGTLDAINQYENH